MIDLYYIFEMNENFPTTPSKARNIHQMNWVVIIIIIWHSKTKTCDVQSTFLFYSCKKKIIHSRKEKPHYSISKTVIINCSPNTVRHARHVDEKISASFFSVAQCRLSIDTVCNFCGMWTSSSPTMNIYYSLYKKQNTRRRRQQRAAGKCE